MGAKFGAFAGTEYRLTNPNHGLAELIRLKDTRMEEERSHSVSRQLQS